MHTEIKLKLFREVIGKISNNYAIGVLSISIKCNLLLLRAENSAPKEKESSKREKLKDRENEHVLVQPSTTAVHRSPRSLGELQIRFDFKFHESKTEGS